MTAVMRVKPWAAFTSADSDFENLVRSAFGSTTSWVPAADVVQSGDDAVITLEIPGVKPEDVTVEVKERHLVISGERSVTEAAESDAVIRREIRGGEFSRSFRLPAHVTADSVSASAENGMLFVRVAGVRPPQPEPTRIPVQQVIREQ